MMGSSGSGEELYTALHTPIAIPLIEEQEDNTKPARKQANKTRFKHRK
jgi:hypothetical protein